MANYPWLLLGTWALYILPCIHAECPHGGWEERRASCYLFVLEPQTQADAQTECVNQEGNLTSVADEEENNFISNFSLIKCGDAVCPSVWFGLTKMGNLTSEPSDEGWTWLDGSTYDNGNYNKWKANEPTGGVKCARMYVRGQVAGEWGDLNCGETFPYVCKQRATSISSPMTPTAQPSTTAPPAQSPRENSSTSVLTITEDVVKTGLIAGISCMALVLIITILVVIVIKYRHYIESKCLWRTRGQSNRLSAQHSNSALIDDEECANSPNATNATTGLSSSSDSIIPSYGNVLEVNNGPERLPASHAVALPCTNEDARDGYANCQAKVKSGTKQKTKKSSEVQQNQSSFNNELDPKYDNTRPERLPASHAVALPCTNEDARDGYANSQAKVKSGTKQKTKKSSEVQQNQSSFNNELDPKYDNTRPHISDGQHGVAPSIAIDGASQYSNVNSQDVQPNQQPFYLDHNYDNTRSGEGMSRSQPNLTLGHDLISVEDQKMHQKKAQLTAELREHLDNHGDARTRLDLEMGREAKNHVTLPANSTPADSDSSETGYDNIPEQYKGTNLDGEQQSWIRNKRPIFAQLSYIPTTSDHEGTEHYANTPEHTIYDQDHYRHLDATNRQTEKYEKVEARMEAVTVDHKYVDVIA